MALGIRARRRAGKNRSRVDGLRASLCVRLGSGFGASELPGARSWDITWIYAHPSMAYLTRESAPWLRLIFLPSITMGCYLQQITQFTLLLTMPLCVRQRSCPSRRAWLQRRLTFPAQFTQGKHFDTGHAPFTPSTRGAGRPHPLFPPIYRSRPRRLPIPTYLPTYPFPQTNLTLSHKPPPPPREGVEVEDWRSLVLC